MDRVERVPPNSPAIGAIDAAHAKIRSSKREQSADERRRAQSEAEQQEEQPHPQDAPWEDERGGEDEGHIDVRA